MASYLGNSYQAAVGPTGNDIILFAGLLPPESHGFSPAPGGIWRKEVTLKEVDALWESRPIGNYHGEQCLVLDDLGDRLHVLYLGKDAHEANRLGYWQVDRGVFEVVVPRGEIVNLAEERHEFRVATEMGQKGGGKVASAIEVIPPVARAGNLTHHDNSPPVPAILRRKGSHRKNKPSTSVEQSVAEVDKVDEVDEAAVFDLAIRRSGEPGRFAVEVLSSEAGEATSSVALDVDELLTKRERLQWAVLASAVASRRVIPETERPVREIGKRLFSSLLGTGDVAGQYRAAAALAAKRGQRLRVSLRIDVPEVAALPWEAMYDETADEYVCRLDQFVRHIGVARAQGPLRIRPPLRILGVVSSPRGLPLLDIEKEQDNLTRALARPVNQGLVELRWSSAATWDDLHSMLLEGPWHVVHYIGHGDFDAVREEGFLALVGDDGRAQHVAAHRLVDLLRQASPMPRLIILNSCSGAQASTSDLFSSTAAALVRGGASAVAAMQFAISDHAAVAFARGFYTAIAHGRGIDGAVSSGRVAILGTSDYTLEWLTPVLYLRGHDAQLFKIS